MKTPEEIKRGLALCKVDECFGEREDCPYAGDPALCVGKMCDDVLAYIQQLEQRVPRWISVEERLPETQWPVIIALKRDGEGIRIAIGSRAHWTPHRYYINGGSCAIDADRVTHWMPLLEPPEEDAE